MVLKRLKAFGQAVRKIRVDGGLTQTELAIASNISSPCLSDLERSGIASPATIQAVARGLGYEEGSEEYYHYFFLAGIVPACAQPVFSSDPLRYSLAVKAFRQVIEGQQCD